MYCFGDVEQEIGLMFSGRGSKLIVVQWNNEDFRLGKAYKLCFILLRLVKRSFNFRFNEESELTVLWKKF